MLDVQDPQFLMLLSIHSSHFLLRHDHEVVQLPDPFLLLSVSIHRDSAFLSIIFMDVLDGPGFTVYFPDCADFAR